MGRRVRGWIARLQIARNQRFSCAECLGLAPILRYVNQATLPPYAAHFVHHSTLPLMLGDLARVNSNSQAFSALAQLNKTNGELGQRQMRLATGKRINAAEDDSAGYAIARKLEAKTRGQAQALSNIGDAKSMLTVAEGSLGIGDGHLADDEGEDVQAGNDTMGTDERTKIKNQLDALSAEVTDILGDTEFNGTSLFSSTGDTSLTFQVNAESGDTFTATIGSASVGAFGVATGSLAVGSNASAGTTLTAIDNAIDAVSDRLAGLGDSQKRLSFKQDNLTTSMNNYESARSRIEDADFAKEQMNIVKAQILQQTGTASLAQANSAPQSILSLIG